MNVDRDSKEFRTFCFELDRIYSKWNDEYGVTVTRDKCIDMICDCFGAVGRMTDAVHEKNYQS